MSAGSNLIISREVEKICACKETVLLIDDNAFNLYPLIFCMEQEYGIYADIGEDG